MRNVIGGYLEDSIDCARLALGVHCNLDNIRKTSVFTARGQGQTPKAVELLYGQS